MQTGFLCDYIELETFSMLLIEACFLCSHLLGLAPIDYHAVLPATVDNGILMAQST
jgi:hypothetical protein